MQVTNIVGSRKMNYFKINCEAQNEKICSSLNTAQHYTQVFAYLATKTMYISHLLSSNISSPIHLSFKRIAKKSIDTISIPIHFPAVYLHLHQKKEALRNTGLVYRPWWQYIHLKCYVEFPYKKMLHPNAYKNIHIARRRHRRRATHQLFQKCRASPTGTSQIVQQLHKRAQICNRISNRLNAIILFAYH